MIVVMRNDEHLFANNFSSADANISSDTEDTSNTHVVCVDLFMMDVTFEMAVLRDTLPIYESGIDQPTEISVQNMIFDIR